MDLQNCYGKDKVSGNLPDLYSAGDWLEFLQQTNYRSFYDSFWKDAAIFKFILDKAFSFAHSLKVMCFTSAFHLY